VEGSVRYFRSEDIHDPTEELAGAEAKLAGDYVAAHYEGGRAVRANIVRGGTVKQVIYYERPASEAELLRHHLEAYGAVPYRSVRPLASPAGTVEIYSFAADGTLKEIDQETRDASGGITREVRMRPSREPIGIIEYAYSPTGALASVRELNPDGSLVHEERLIP
jgi:hypothetical protein